MTIRINQIAVEFTLENEKTMADLTTALRAWAQNQNLAVLGILADGRSLGPDDPTLLENITEIEVEAVPAGERDLARVAVVSRFFALLARGWEQNDRRLVRDLRGEFAAVKAAMSPLFDPLGDRISGPLGVLEGDWDQPSETMVAAFRLLADATECRRKELQDPLAALSETIGALDRNLDNLGDLGVLFQKGRDRDGLDRILTLFNLIEDLGRRAELVLGSDESARLSWAGFQADLGSLLKETEGALGSGDFILLTDLLEYEVAPRLRQAQEYFPGISNLDRATPVL